MHGSPPHTRGRSAVVRIDKAERGFTPAYAGKMLTGTPASNGLMVHPRIRGEDNSADCRDISLKGSPPHMQVRFTPAYAGKISLHARLNRDAWVHPRIRGEDKAAKGGDAKNKGSPPHTRGRYLPTASKTPMAGFTPAYAGKIPV